ncbi:MAG: M16 family metallopeptidase [Acidobacteriota bacterium]
MILFFLLTTSSFLYGILQVEARKELPAIPIEYHSLKNGLKVFLNIDNSLPVVSVGVGYQVGSLFEKEDKAGLTYLMENLMFQGSRNVGRMQHIRYIQRVGGVLNAQTSFDRLLLYQTVPSHHLPLVFWLESDRMNSLNINPATVRNCIDSVRDEIKSFINQDPYLESFFLFNNLLYSDFAYAHFLFGNESNLNKITIDDVIDFYETFFNPNNAVICVAGDIEPRKTLELIEKYFGSIPAGKESPEIPSPPSFPEEKREGVYQISKIPSPALHLGYRVAPAYSNEMYALTLIEYILLKGKSSRLQKRLLQKERVATQLQGGLEKKGKAAAFKLFVKSNNLITLERSKKAIFAEIDRIKTELISVKELEKIKNQFRKDYLNQFLASEDKILFLCEAFFSGKNPDNQIDEYKKYLQVTPSDIIGIANRYFGNNHVLLEIQVK